MHFGIIWYNVSLGVNKVNLLMQNSALSVAAVETLKSVLNYLKKLRTDEKFQNLIVTARKLADTIDLILEFEKVR